MTWEAFRSQLTLPTVLCASPGETFVAIPKYSAEFTSELIRYPGEGGWTFARVPPEHAPAVAHGWGRTPVRATVDGSTWETSVWRGKDGQTLLAVPKKIRGTKDHMDTVHVRLEYSIEYR